MRALQATSGPSQADAAPAHASDISNLRASTSRLPSYNAVLETKAAGSSRLGQEAAAPRRSGSSGAAQVWCTEHACG